MIPGLLKMNIVRLSYLPRHLPWRSLSGSSRYLQQKDTPATSDAAGKTDQASGENKPPGSMQHAYKPDNFERKMLVWTKKYKSVEDVPNYVSREEMEKCRSKMRIRISNLMILATLIGCIIMGKFLPLVISGKQAAERGETVAKQNRDWHDSLKEEKKKEEDQAALAKAYNTK
ncbi:UPF0389 protein CG9231 [Sergentomyia squamirostris]